MSFLNPVSEPVKRFSSTDAGAPQINYAARVAGDVKTVLKACLVTGYGTKAGAGWTTVNEVDHVAEFVSPSAVMSDYRIGVDDSSASSTTWYYCYKDNRVNPAYNSPSKNLENIDKASTDNGWELIISNMGVCFIEVIKSPAVAAKVGRITYFSQLKAAVSELDTPNIAFFNTGVSSQNPTPVQFFQEVSTGRHSNSIGGRSDLQFKIANSALLEKINPRGANYVELTSAFYLFADNSLYAEYPGILIKDMHSSYGVFAADFGGRPVLSACISLANSSAPTINRYSVNIMIYLDYWEY